MAVKVDPSVLKKKTKPALYKTLVLFLD